MHYASFYFILENFWIFFFTIQVPTVEGTPTVWIFLENSKFSDISNRTIGENRTIRIHLQLSLR